MNRRHAGRGSRPAEKSFAGEQERFQSVLIDLIHTDTQVPELLDLSIASRIS
jgi:hypothetical protein